MAIDILVVDDEADIRLGLSGILEDEGFFVRTAQGDAEARRQVPLRCQALFCWIFGCRVVTQTASSC